MFFYNGTKIQLFSFAKSMCSIPGVRATYHTSSWTFITSPIAQKYAYFSPCAACVTFYVNFPTNFHCFSLFFGYIEWNKHSLSSPRRGVVPKEWWGPMRRSDDQEIWRNMLEKQALPNFRPSSQFRISRFVCRSVSSSVRLSVCRSLLTFMIF